MKTLRQILNCLAERRGERPFDWGARKRSVTEIVEWMTEHGWNIAPGSVQRWIDGFREPNPAAQVLLNQMLEELTEEHRK